jgi:hypothetical protein
VADKKANITENIGQTWFSGRMRILRWSGAGLLVLVSALLIVASVAARFARSEVLNTDRYVATVAPLADDPGLQAAVKTRVSDAVVKAIDAPRLLQELATSVDIRGAQAAITLASPAINDWINGQVNRVIGDFVASPDFVTVWTQANRAAHMQVNQLLTGKDSGVVTADEGDIVVDLGQVFDVIRDRLVQRGWSFLSRVPDQSIHYTVAHIDNLPQLRRYVSLLDKAATWLPVLALGLLGLAVWCAPDRRRGLLIGLLVTVVVLLLTIGVYAIVRSRYASTATARGLNATNALTLWDTLLAYFVKALVTVTITVLLAAIWTYLSGPGRVATAFRQGVNRLLDPIARLIGPHDAVRDAVRRWPPWAAVVIAALGLWWLLARPTVATAVTVVVLAAVITALLTIVRRLPDQPRLPEPASAE